MVCLVMGLLVRGRGVRGEVAAEETHRVEERGVRLGCWGQRQGRAEAVDVDVEGALVAVREEDVEARPGRGLSVWG